jgi:putative FmdB family regulatory protein
MPIFEYVCKDCSKNFEALVYGEKKAQCPHCKSKRLEQKLSVFAVSAPARSGASSCGSCGDPRGRGACSMDD